MATVVNARDALLQGTSTRLVLVDLPTNVSIAALRSVDLSASSLVVRTNSSGLSPQPSSLTLQATLVGFPAGTVPTWAVTAGTATLSGSGLTRTVDTTTITSSTVEVLVSASYNGSTYTDRVTISKVADGSVGTNGARGSQDVVRAITGSAWSDTEALAALVASLGSGATPVVNDTCTLYNASAQYSEMRRYSGTTWAAVAQSLPGSVIMPGSVTTEKLVVTGMGVALNSDPNTQDVSAWLGTGVSIVNDTSSPNGATCLNLTNSASLVTSRKFPVDPTKNYRIRTWVKQQSGTATAYLGVVFYDGNGNVISGASQPSGWAAAGDFHYFGLVGTAMPTSWTEYSADFGANESFKVPAAARFAAFGILPNFNGPGVQRVCGVLAHLKTTGDMIVDGTVTASKINARGLEIQDASGAVVLKAGQSVNWSLLGGAQGNLTNLGYIGDLNATRGAPSGTSVGGVPAETLVESVSSLSTGLAAKLDKAGGLITGRVTMTVADGIFAGSDTSNGVYMGSGGLVGKKGGATTFAIDTAGNAVFGGSLNAPSGTLGVITAGFLTSESGRVSLNLNPATSYTPVLSVDKPDGTPAARIYDDGQVVFNKVLASGTYSWGTGQVGPQIVGRVSPNVSDESGVAYTRVYGTWPGSHIEASWSSQGYQHLVGGYAYIDTGVEVPFSTINSRTLVARARIKRAHFTGGSSTGPAGSLLARLDLEASVVLHQWLYKDYPPAVTEVQTVLIRVWLKPYWTAYGQNIHNAWVNEVEWALDYVP